MTVRRTFALVLGMLALVVLYLVSRNSYLLFHSLIELFTILVGAGIFVIAWNARDYIQNNYLLFVGIASLFVAFLDLFHALAYEGMGVFEGPTADLATQYWVAGRSLEAATLLLAPFFLDRRLYARVQMAAFALVTALLVLSISTWRVFPTSFVEGVGLTPFKVWAEYVISASLLVAAVLLFRKRDAFAPAVWRLIVAFLLLSAAAELAFTAYFSVYGGANLLGHLLRVAAAFLLYKAIIETALVEPYDVLLRNLKRSQDRLEEYATALELTNEELRKSENRLREQAADLMERNEELDAFARTVAHDLKSLVGVILTHARTVTSIQELPREHASSLLDRIAETASDLAGIVDNLLLLARVRKEEVPRHRLDMPDHVMAVQKRLSEMIHAHEAEVYLGPAWPSAVGYGPWVEEVWANYLTNALKYGGPRPRVELGGAMAENGSARFWVRDHGQGIAEEDRTTLFVPFRRLGIGRGHGLGLSIVLQIVDKLGGEVGVESGAGKGSLFWFTLPAAEVSEEEGDGAGEEPVPHHGAGRRERHGSGS